MSWAAMPYVISRSAATAPRRPFGRSAAGFWDISASFGSLALDAVEVVVVLVAEIPLTKDAALPRGHLGDHVWQQAQGIVRRHDRQTDHVADEGDQEDVLERRAGFDGMSGELVAGHAIGELAERMGQLPCPAHE